MKKKKRSREGGGQENMSSPFSDRKYKEGFHPLAYVFFCAAAALTMLLCICVGSVRIPPGTTLKVIWEAVRGLPGSVDGSKRAIILSVRLPRVLCVALTGGALSICGAAMQGLLRNPLADGSTLGVSSGASLGAALSIAFGMEIPFLHLSGTMPLAMLFAFLSMLCILTLAYRLDSTLSTNTIILLGIVYSMFISSILSLVVTFASDRVKHITFWTMGSLAGSNYTNVRILAVCLAVGAIVLCRTATELNAFSLSEDNARNIGVNVRRIRLIVLITVSAVIGVCVSVGGSIGFVGLVTPHMVRMVTGPNHYRLLPASLFFGAIFLLLADLAARTIFSPVELPIGAVTSFVGAILFIYIFYQTRGSGA